MQGLQSYRYSNVSSWWRIIITKRRGTCLLCTFHVLQSDNCVYTALEEMLLAFTVTDILNKHFCCRILSSSIQPCIVCIQLCVCRSFCYRNIPDRFASPCGGCRQIISEFGNYWVILTKPDGTYEQCTVSDLLPNGFTKTDLAAGQK